MDVLGAIIGSVGLLSIIISLFILAQFGRKLGAVTKMRAYYLAYYGAAALLILAFITRMVRTSVFWAPSSEIPPVLNSPWFYLLLYHVPLAIGLTVALVVNWLYWSWLLKE